MRREGTQKNSDPICSECKFPTPANDCFPAAIIQTVIAALMVLHQNGGDRHATCVLRPDRALWRGSELDCRFVGRRLMTPDETSLSQLMIMAQRGDKEAYSALLRECQHWMKAYLGRRISRHDLDDLVQETLLALHQKLATYDSSRAFMPWLAAIARYRWAGHLRQVYRARAQSGETDVVAQNDEPAMMARISLDSLFAQLPEAQARAIELVKIDGLSIAEAACASGQSEALVKVNIHRGLKKLSAMIERA